MNNIVTLQQLTNIDEELILISNQIKDKNSLLSSQLCEQYEIKIIKKKLQNLFTEFKTAKYLYQFPIGEKIKVTSNYDYNESISLTTKVSKIEKAVETTIDKQIRITGIYNTLLILGSKLTNNEVVYLINTFFKHHSEENIAEKLYISKTYLQKIKKSCIIKMWIDLKKFCDENE